MNRYFGLNLVEWAVLGVIIALLTAILLPSGGGHGRPTRARCIGNLRNQGTAFAIYAADYGGKWPPSSLSLKSLCEQTPPTRDAFLNFGAGNSSSSNLAARQKIFYCPANTAQDPTKLWDSANISIWGYVWMNKRDSASGLPTAFPDRKTPLQYVSNTATLRSPGSVILALDVIVTDTISAPLNFAPKGAVVPFGTNHPPKGGASDAANVLFADNHAESIKFNPLDATPIPQPAGGFFWIPNP